MTTGIMVSPAAKKEEKNYGERGKYKKKASLHTPEAKPSNLSAVEYFTCSSSVLGSTSVSTLNRILQLLNFVHEPRYIGFREYC